MNLLLNPDVALPGTPPASPVDWRAGLPAELQTEPMLKTVPDVATLAKNYINAERMIGQKRLVVPGEKAQQVEWDAVWNTLGRPETHDKYPDSTVKPAEGLVLDANGLKTAKETFHKLGLSTKQAQGILDFYMQGVNTVHSAVQSQAKTSTAQATETLRQEWGDKFDVNMEVARAVIKQHGSEQLFNELDAGLGNHVGLIKLLHKFGASMIEGSNRQGQGSLQVGQGAQAVAEIEQMKLDQDFQKALHDARHTGHKAAVDRWMDSHRRAYPGQQRE